MALPLASPPSGAPAGAVQYGDDAPRPLPPAPIEPAWILAGEPVAGAVCLTSNGHGLSTGLWECSAGRFHWIFGSDEIIHVLEGEVRIEEDGREPVTLGPGDIAHFPTGARTIWTVPDRVRKFYVDQAPPPSLARRVARRLLRR